jgi:carboxypeptidase C (cathepsin A)
MLGVLDEKSHEAATALCDPVKQYSGYFNLTSGIDKHYFYWFFESRHAPATDPVILWMTGGPGCSSLVDLVISPFDYKNKINLLMD